MPGTVIAWSCLVLGAVVMYVTMMFLTRLLKKDNNATLSNLSKALGVLLGGTVLGFLTTQLGGGASNFAWYGIGLGVGLVLYALASVINTGLIPTFNRTRN